MRALGILYDRSGAGEFFHAYTRSFDGRFFFEIVQRRGYDGFGAVNASVRLAAQALSERAEYVARRAGRTRAVKSSLLPSGAPSRSYFELPTAARTWFRHKAAQSHLRALHPDPGSLIPA